MTFPSDKTVLRELKTQMGILGGLIAVLWLVQILNAGVFQNQLAVYGIHPRHLSGLDGILWAPFIHGNFQHLMANTLPLLTLGWLVMLQRTADFWVVSGIAMLVSGLGTWIVGSPSSTHIGASGIVFGYFGYLLLRGYFERSFTSVLVSLLVMFIYGSLIWGVLPTQPGVSWEGHLFGFIGGGIAARWLARKSP